MLRVRRLAIAAGVAAALCAGAYASRASLLGAAGAFLVEADPPAPSDAIVVLSGSLPDRILAAVDLYHAGLAPRIVLTQEQPLPGLAELRARGASMQERHEQNLDIARQLGVPREALVVVTTPAWSTATEAEALAAWFREANINAVLLVTSKPHSRRAGLTLRDATGGRVRVRVVPSPHDPFDPQAWWQRRPWARRLVFEYLKLANYVLLERWRAPAPPPAT